MKKRLVGILLTAIAAFGLVAVGTTTSGTASAVTVQDSGSRIYLGFNRAETKQLARNGVAGILDHPAIRPYRNGGIDVKSRYRVVNVPGRGRLRVASTNQLIREAAQHNGRVWISFNKSGRYPLTLWTRW